MNEQKNEQFGITPLDEIEAALISIADGIPPEEAAQKAFDVINRERITVRATPDPSITEKAERLAASIVSRERLDYNWVRDLIASEFQAGAEVGPNQDE
jgi:N12 class adenine-specific DNA methylase